MATNNNNNNGNNKAKNEGKQNRGFAAMDKEKQREIASKGGQASHGGGRKSSNE